MTDGEQVCPSCGLVAPEVDGPTDPYGASTPACWAMLGRLHLVGGSQLAVDAYLAQHASVSTPAGCRSVLTHLVGLTLALHSGESAERIRQVLGAVFPDKQADPPAIRDVPDLRGRTVADVVEARPEQRDARTREWAGSVWDAWAAEHARVIELADLAVRRARVR